MNIDQSVHQEKEPADINTDSLLSIYPVLFEQVKLQQEVRDRWFGHYISIIAAIVTLATLCLKFFEDSTKIESIYFMVGLIFILAGVLGVLFYVLYLCQRQNYRQVYAKLYVIQTVLLESSLPNDVVKDMSIGFKTRRYGADYFTLLIENVLCSACIGIGTGFIVRSLTSPKAASVAFSILGFLLSVFVLLLVRHLSERRIKEHENRQAV